MNETRQMPERLAQMRHVDAVRRQFERVWQEGGEPRIDDELAAADLVERADLLAELLPLEWAYRQLRGDEFAREEYRDRFPGQTEIVDRLWERWLDDNKPTADGHGNHGEQALAPGRSPEHRDDIHFPPSTGPSSYEQLEPLGQGGMGVVYRAFDPRLRRRVALKRLHTVSVQRLVRLQREAEALARLQHPHIVTIYGWEELSGQPVLVLEYVMGGSLEERLGVQPLSVDDSARLTSILARAVQAAHDVGIVHRDLKPSNVLLAPAVPGSSGTVADFFPKVSDFGLARIESTGEVSECGIVVGTADYMSPEQVEGRTDDVGSKTDVWAIGVILYRCLTYRLPFSGRTVLETLERVKSGAYSPPNEVCPDLPDELVEICRGCLEKDLVRRPSAGEMADLLDSWLASRSVSSPSCHHIRRRLKAELRTRAVTPRRWRRLVLAGCIVIGLVMALASGWLLRSHADDGQVPRTSETEAVEPFRIVDFRAQHLRIVGDPERVEGGNLPAENLGEIGKDSSELRFGDMFRVDVKLSRESYLYLVAFNADGMEQLLWPVNDAAPLKGGDPEIAPRVVESLHYPPNHPETGNPIGVTLNDETNGGMQGIALLVSAEPLPRYADYLAAREEVNWKKQRVGKGVWLADTRSVFTAWAGLGVVRGEPVNEPSAQPLMAFARQLKKGGVELVEVLAFPVGAQPNIGEERGHGKKQ
jgi:hypothetical protein